MPLLHGESPRHGEAQPGHIAVHQTTSFLGSREQMTAAGAMQQILSDAVRQNLNMSGHSVHKGQGPAHTAFWASFHLSFVGSTGLALLHVHLRLSGQLAVGNPLLDFVLSEIQLPTAAQTLDVLLHAPARGHGADDEIVRFKELVRNRMNGYIESFNPSLARQVRTARSAVNDTSENSLFVPAAHSYEGTMLWINELVHHVLDIVPRPAANLGAAQTTNITIPHLGVHHPTGDRVTVQLHHLNLGAILFFEIRKIWMHLDPSCPLRPTHQSEQRPVAYASLFNLILLGELNREHANNDLCQTNNFRRIAHDVLGNSYDDLGQRDLFGEFQNWVRQTFDTPRVRDQIVSETLAWLHHESLHLHALDEEDDEEDEDVVGAELGRLIKRQLKQVVELLE